MFGIVSSSKRLFALIVILSTTVAVGNGAEEASSDCSARESTLEFGYWIDPGIILSANAKSTTISPDRYTFRDHITSWRLQLSDNTNSEVNWLVTVRDSRGRPLAIIRRASQADASKNVFTERLLSSQLEIDVEGLKDGDGQIKVTGAAAYPKESKDTRLFSIQGKEPSWASPYPSGGAAVLRLADSVGMLLTGSTDPQTFEQKSWSCSGVLVGESLFLTNWHCGGQNWQNHALFWNNEVRANCLMDFRWDEGTSRSQFACGDVVAQNEGLDYALLRLSPLANGPSLSSLPAAVPISVTNAPNQLFVLHHALSLPKLLSKNCSVVQRGDNDPNFFEHNCDTDPGASGGPVFDASTKRLVGLHHAGFKRDKDCKVLDAVNEAVRIAPIITNACENNTKSIMNKFCEENKQ
ncbi:trypsin-like serine peptidase [Phyllobacterium chamaecytisi]|uniref:trypsin-like serine peptidase n=1 Tax=Phyllobacterium chamaecytisi TaxID=2876082 RepID=UPI001CCACB90|nr:serine protease [Phyllobacterium sp. KW56]MBZ9602603.1 serine protease [Phyllobacterium sp. KW56]